MRKITEAKRKLLQQINGNIIHNCQLENFDRQLLDLISGNYNVSNPMVISDSTQCLNYIDIIDADKPLVINVSTVIKIRERHSLGYAFVARCEEMLGNSVLAFESETQPTSLVILLDEIQNNTPIVAICRYDKNVGYIDVNEITSIYDRSRFENLLIRAWEDNKTFWRNKKTKQYFSSTWLQLPPDLNTALYKNIITYPGESFKKAE